jgi:predicted signal transduction protein with EAL and GGDEF domain
MELGDSHLTGPRGADRRARGSVAEPSARSHRGLSAAPGQPFVAMVGIERFSGVREDLGETGANAVVGELCARIRRCAPAVHLGRINRSSIEFTFFADDFAAAEAILTDLQAELHAPIALAERRMTLDVAIGFAGRGVEGEPLEGLVDRAEHALAKARAGHARIGAFTEADVAERTDRLALMRDLRVAVANDELFVCYLPKLNLRTTAIRSAEALLRWRHPTRGMVGPDRFVPLAEEAGEIRPMTERVIEHVREAAAALERAGHTVRLDVNISGHLVSDPGFAAWALEAVGGRPGRFGFEITETAVIANPDRALAHIRAFSDAGIAIAIDDYGSGLSSL